MKRLAIVLLAAGCPSKDDADGDTDAVVESDPPAVETDDDTDGTDSDTDLVGTDTDVVAACQLGWGETEFHAITDGAEVPVIRGLQGRWHVPGAVRCQGIDPGRSFEELDQQFGYEGFEPGVWWRMREPDQTFLGGYPPEDVATPLYRPMKTEDGPALLNEFLVLWTNTYEEAVNRDAIMTFALTDKDGVHVELSVPVRLVDPSPPVDTDTDTDLPTP